MIIGICGKSGCGKSTISESLLKLRKDVIHCNIDNIGHSVLFKQEVKEEMLKQFGNCVFDENSINRKKLAELVFISRENMQTLSLITWKYIKEEINKIIENNKDKQIILDWILLSETEFFDICDIKVLIDTSYEIRKERAIKRDNIKPEDFDLREKASIEYNKSKFDFVIDGNDINLMKGLVMKLDKSIISR